MTVPSCGVWEPQVGPRAPVSRISQDHRVARPARVRRRPIPGLRATPERPRRARTRAVLHRRSLHQGLPATRCVLLPRRSIGRVRCGGRRDPGTAPAHSPVCRRGTTSRSRMLRSRRSSVAGSCPSATTSVSFAEGTGPRVYQELFRSERFARLQKYHANITSRESFKNSFDSVRIPFGPMRRGYH